MDNNKTPMSAEDFTKYMHDLKDEWDFRNKCYELGIDDIMGKMQSFDIAIAILCDVFHDVEEILPTWVYEKNFGDRCSRLYRRESGDGAAAHPGECDHRGSGQCQ